MPDSVDPTKVFALGLLQTDQEPFTSATPVAFHFDARSGQLRALHFGDLYEISGVAEKLGRSALLQALADAPGVSVTKELAPDEWECSGCRQSVSVDREDEGTQVRILNESVLCRDCAWDCETWNAFSDSVEEEVPPI